MELADLPYHFKQRPFLVKRMTQPGESFLDVETVHQREFNALVRASREALENCALTGAVVWGDPGIGKSHLLAAQQVGQGRQCVVRFLAEPPRQRGAAAVLHREVRLEPTYRGKTRLVSRSRAFTK